MENEEIVTADTPNGDELELDLDTTEDAKPEDDVQALKEQNKKLFARAKKAEGFELKDGKWSKATKPVETKPEVKELSQELSNRDTLLLAKADVDLDDVDEVVDFAKYRKITIAEALKNSTLKAILADKKEERTTAKATQMTSSRKSSQPSADALLERAQKGEAKEEDIDKIVQARMDAKLKK